MNDVLKEREADEEDFFQKMILPKERKLISEGMEALLYYYNKFQSDQSFKNFENFCYGVSTVKATCNNITDNAQHYSVEKQVRKTGDFWVKKMEEEKLKYSEH